MATASSLNAQLQALQVEAPPSSSNTSSQSSGCTIDSAFRLLTALTGIAGAVVGAVNVFEQQFEPSPPNPPAPPPPDYFYPAQVVFASTAYPQLVTKDLSGIDFVDEAFQEQYFNPLVGSASAKPTVGYYAKSAGYVDCPLISGDALVSGIPLCSTLKGIYYVGPTTLQPTDDDVQEVTYETNTATSLAESQASFHTLLDNYPTYEFVRFDVENKKIQVFNSSTAFETLTTTSGVPLTLPSSMDQLRMLSIRNIELNSVETLDPPDDSAGAVGVENGRIVFPSTVAKPANLISDVGSGNPTFVLVDGCQSRTILNNNDGCATVTDCNKYAAMSDEGVPYLCVESVAVGEQGTCKKSLVQCGVDELRFDNSNERNVVNEWSASPEPNKATLLQNRAYAPNGDCTSAPSQFQYLTSELAPSPLPVDEYDPFSPQTLVFSRQQFSDGCSKFVDKDGHVCLPCVVETAEDGSKCTNTTSTAAPNDTPGGSMQCISSSAAVWNVALLPSASDPPQCSSSSGTFCDADPRSSSTSTSGPAVSLWCADQKVTCMPPTTGMTRGIAHADDFFEGALLSPLYQSPPILLGCVNINDEPACTLPVQSPYPPSSPLSSNELPYCTCSGDAQACAASYATQARWYEAVTNRIGVLRYGNLLTDCGCSTQKAAQLWSTYALYYCSGASVALYPPPSPPPPSLPPPFLPPPFMPPPPSAPLGCGGTWGAALPGECPSEPGAKTYFMGSRANGDVCPVAVQTSAPFETFITQTHWLRLADNCFRDGESSLSFETSPFTAFEVVCPGVLKFYDSTLGELFLYFGVVFDGNNYDLPSMTAVYAKAGANAECATSSTLPTPQFVFEQTASCPTTVECTAFTMGPSTSPSDKFVDDVQFRSAPTIFFGAVSAFMVNAPAITYLQSCYGTENQCIASLPSIKNLANCNQC